VLCQLRTFDDPNLLSSDIPFADSGIYRLSDELALVQSVDFFTPIVDDPADYGRIAAANALSDIYAVGGRPLTALNLCGFPKGMEDTLVKVLNGGAEKVAEAGAVIVGGHTVEDAEPKYGLAVTGLVDPRKMVTTAGGKSGDILILTKPLGTGILATALKGGVISPQEMDAAVQGMKQLNRVILDLLPDFQIHACTDITGFGLIGHGSEMAQASKLRLNFQFDALPLYPRVLEMADNGLVPGGSHRNREFYLPQVINGDLLSHEQLDILADPQTSGGLLLAVPVDQATAILQQLDDRGTPGWQVGHLSDDAPGLYLT
jgi:selenide,water dikinase